MPHPHSKLLKKAPVIFILIIIIVGLLSSFALKDQSSPASVSSSVNENPVSGTIPQLSANAYSTVNPYYHFSAEPAPMGIADYGLGPNNTPYSYNTSSFLGKVFIKTLSVNGAGSESMTFQLNVNLVVDVGSESFVYWVQNVAYVNTNSYGRSVQFIDNVWNMSSQPSSMYGSTISGNGTVESSSSGAYYYDVAGNLPGNNVSISYPFTVELKVSSYLYQGGGNEYPAVAFEYNDGYGWVTYDNAVLKFASNPSGVSFLVDGSNYNPYGIFYDAELVMGGPGNGAQATDSSSNVSLQLDYWNGNNYQMVVNAYNFGGDTQEAISNVVSSTLLSTDGNLTPIFLNGGGSLGLLYSRSDISVLGIRSLLSSGYLYINGTQVTDFTGGAVNVTLHPGNYTVDLYDSNMNLYSEGQIDLIAGEYLNTTMGRGFYPVYFSENGLSSGKEWSVTVNGTTEYSTSGNITFSLKNGTYDYTIGTVSGFHSTSYHGTFNVNGSAGTIPVNWTIVTYNVSFDESGLPAGTQWSVLFNGTNEDTNGTVICYTLPNGTYNYSLSTEEGYHTSQYSGFINVTGSNVTKEILWSIFRYNITFRSSGLPNGKSWYVILDGVKETSSGSEITFNLPNGTYSYTISNISGYLTIPDKNLNVNNSSLSINVQFVSKYSLEAVYPVLIFASIGIVGSVIAYRLREE